MHDYVVARKNPQGLTTLGVLLCADALRISATGRCLRHVTRLQANHRLDDLGR